MRLVNAVLALRFVTVVAVVFALGAAAGADIVWILTPAPRPTPPAPRPPFTFNVEHGQCACTFDDPYDFATDRERVVRATICQGR